MTVNFYYGTPYKYNLTIKDHTRFVQCVRFSNDGDLFCSAGIDRKIFVYDGKTGERKTELTKVENSHQGGVFSVSWSPDGTKLLSSSADNTVKLWDVAAEKVIKFQQVGTLWSGSHLLSLSLNGDINYFSPNTSTPIRTVRGHQKAITALTSDIATKTLYTGSYDGRVYSWGLGESKVSGGGTPVEGGHTNQVAGLSVDDGKVVSVGFDDTMRSFLIGDKEFDANVTPTGSLPTSVSSAKGVSVTVTKNHDIIIKSGAALSTTAVSFTPTVVAIAPDAGEISVGADDNKIYTYKINGTEITQSHVFENNRGSITCISYSPNGELLVAGDAERSIICYDVNEKKVKITQWMFHTSRITSVAWSPDSLHCASGSLDTNVEIWSVRSPTKHIAIKGAHLESVNRVTWVDNDTVASAGQDASIKVWKIKHVA
ncbi:hypothetical protein HK096_004353 [Nowakowskiella sp. JEL0078]|nr:hypothetical protein HK096_004353 [Nowakowskiella sp. JEL0078]